MKENVTTLAEREVTVSMLGNPKALEMCMRIQLELDVCLFIFTWWDKHHCFFAQWALSEVLTTEVMLVFNIQ